MNEHSYIRSVHRKLPSDIHAWKINANFSNGVADAWYSGSGGDAWVEYKYISRVPVRTFTPGLSALQRSWLKGRASEGRCVSVIVACPEGSAILTEPEEWENKVKAPKKWLTVQEVVQWIVQHTLYTSISAGQMTA